MGTQIANAYIQILPSMQGMQGSIQQGLGGEAEAAGTSAGATIASRIKSAIVAAGIGAVLKATIFEGAELEQSIGGVETLFKDSAQTVMDNAAEAYKTAGISANQYMQQSTSFAAALLSSLGGDAAAAAEAADTAIIDMADNANKMGTSLESIQNAYQGFAKQNYTMLDNLKLGYGGTKEEMERLLADAQALSGVEYDISNLSDVYSAIHIIQNELGITGATALEAESTLSGSFYSMKAAAQNFLGNLALGENVQPALKNLIDTAINFLTNNLIPAVVNIVAGLPDVIISVVTEGLPQLLEQGITMIGSLASGLAEGIPDFVEKVIEMQDSLISTVINDLPRIIKTGADVVVGLIQGIANALPIIIKSAPEMITAIITGLISALPQIFESAGDIIMALIDGLVSAIPDLILAIPQIITAIVDTLLNTDWGEVGKGILDGITEGFVNAAPDLWDNVKKTGNSLLTGAKSLLGIQSPSTVFRDQVGAMIPLGIAEGIDQNLNPVTAAVDTLSNVAIGTYGMSTPSPVINSSVISAISTAAKIIVDAINSQDTGTYLDGELISRRLYDNLTAESSRRGVSLVGV